MTPEVTIAAATDDVGEGQAAVFALTLGQARSVAMTVSVSVTVDGVRLAGSAPTSATFPALATATTLTLPTADDAVVTGDGTVTATVLAGTGYVLGTPSSGDGDGDRGRRGDVRGDCAPGGDRRGRHVDALGFDLERGDVRGGARHRARRDGRRGGDGLYARAVDADPRGRGRPRRRRPSRRRTTRSPRTGRQGGGRCGRRLPAG